MTEKLNWLSVLALICAGLPADAGERITEAQPLEPFTVPYPTLARHELYGFAEVLFVVDENGTTKDFVVLKETHAAFSQAIILTIRNVRYEPATRDGRPEASRVVFRNHFRLISGASIRHFPARIPNSAELERMARPRVHEIDELDAPLQPLEHALPLYPRALQESGAGGTVLVEFFVDDKGVVRAPAIVSSDRAALRQAVLEAVSEWTFAPPRIDGKPVTTVAYHEFRFRGG